MTLNASLPQAVHNLVVVFNKKGQPDKAVMLLKKAIENNPDDYSLHANLGDMYITLYQKHKGKHYLQQALSAWRKSLETFSDQPKIKENVKMAEKDLIDMGEGKN